MSDEERAVDEFLRGKEPYISPNGKAWWDWHDSARSYLYAEVMRRLEGGRGDWLMRRYNSRREAMAAARAAVLRCIQEGEL